VGLIVVTIQLEEAEQLLVHRRPEKGALVLVVACQLKVGPAVSRAVFINHLPAAAVSIYYTLYIRVCVCVFAVNLSIHAQSNLFAKKF